MPIAFTPRLKLAVAAAIGLLPLLSAGAAAADGSGLRIESRQQRKARIAAAAQAEPAQTKIVPGHSFASVSDSPPVGVPGLTSLPTADVPKEAVGIDRPEIGAGDTAPDAPTDLAPSPADVPQSFSADNPFGVLIRPLPRRRVAASPANFGPAGLPPGFGGVPGLPGLPTGEFGAGGFEAGPYLGFPQLLSNPYLQPPFFNDFIGTYPVRDMNDRTRIQTFLIENPYLYRRSIGLGFVGGGLLPNAAFGF